MTIEQIAGAFSGHRFDTALPHLDDGIVWTVVGGEVLTGRQRVAEACARAAAELAHTTTEFVRFRTIVDDGRVAVDALGEYTDENGGRSAVASCDIYDFTDGKVTAIVSYNIEVPPTGTTA